MSKKPTTKKVIAKSGNIYYAPIKKPKTKKRKKQEDKPLFTKEESFDNVLSSILKK